MVPVLNNGMLTTLKVSSLLKICVLAEIPYRQHLRYSNINYSFNQSSSFNWANFYILANLPMHGQSYVPLVFKIIILQCSNC